MAKLLEKTFAADGSTNVITTKDFIALVGTGGGTNFGSGTLTVEISVDSGVTYTTVQSLTAEGIYQPSREYPGGVNVKLTLAGATSPDLDVKLYYVE